MIKRIKLLLSLILALGAESFAQSYPFNLPENMTATIDITTSNKEAFNNLLLGTNIHDLAKSDGQELVRDFNPITIRFPHGLFSNWYDWEQDKARVYGTDQFTYTKDDGSSRTVELSYLSAIKTMDASNLRVGINELNVLNNEKKAETGKGYDMNWTFNMSADGTDYNNGSPVSVARYKDLVKRGFEVKSIEMGNECFYAGQRSSIIPNPADYIARAKSMYTALKALDPNLQISVPLERKSNPPNTGWNTELTKDGTDYFDAVTVHTYVGYDPDDNSNSNEAYAVALTAREVLRKTIDNYSKVVAPDKPIWLTEWGVKSGGPNAVSALGMADCYLFLSESQDTYDRANWFSVNGKLNSHLVWHEVNGKLTIKEPLEKTSYGSTFQIVRSILENSEMLGSEMTVPTLDGVVSAVSARVVKKDGKTMLLVVNKSDQEVPFTINLDGNRYFGEFEHKAMAFSAMDEEITLPYHTDPLQLVKEGRGGIYLPKLSISTIVLNSTESLPLNFINLKNNDEIDKGVNLVVKADVADQFTEVSLWVNDSLLSTLTEAPYSWSSFPQLMNMMESSYRLKLVGQLENGELIEREITIKTPEQWAFTDDYLPHAIPGKIEVEHYDYGGDGIAFYDKSEQSASYAYRGEDKVDLSSDGTWLKYIQGNEWLEYTVEVERSGSYDLAIKHQTRRTPEFEAMTFSFQDQSEALFARLQCTNTGSDATTIDTFSTAYLEKGRHILRMDILGYGWDMDYFEFILTSLPIDYYNVGSKVNPENPDSYDYETVIENLKTPLDSLGFEFAGWYTNSEFTDTVSVPAVSASDNQAMSFYAKWTPKTLDGFATIYGDIISGQVLTVETSSIENNSGQLIFQWQKSTNGNFNDIPGAADPSYTLQRSDVGSQLRVIVSSSLQFGEIISSTTNVIIDTSDTFYTITYNSNEGVDGILASEIVGNGGFPTFIAQPTKEGFKISHWTNALGDTINAQSMIISDTTFFAQWEVKTRYQVRFNMGGSFFDVMSDGYPAIVKNFPEEPLQADSIFDYWITSKGERFDENYLIFNDMEVFSTWQVKRFPINVISAHGGITFSPKESNYEIHSQVQLTVTPGDKYEFTGWSGDVISTENEILVTVDSTINLTANYESKPYYALEVFFSDGEVTKFPNSSRYLAGDSVLLTATPNNGYEFAFWSGDYDGSENPLKLVMTEDMEIFANFQKETSVSKFKQGARMVVFPNPNYGIFTIKINDEFPANYNIYNLAGMKITGGVIIKEKEIQLNQYNAGVYLLEVETENVKSVEKIIVQ